MNTHSPSSSACAEPSEVPLWEFVRVADYAVPNLPARAAAANTVAAVGQLLRRTEKQEQLPVKQEADLRCLPDQLLERLVPALDWPAAAVALDRALAGWPGAAGAGDQVRFLIGQPCCGHADIACHWGTLHEAACIEPPSYEQILGSDEHWLDDLAGAGRLWVLPNLEWCYLRHHRGLGLVRALLELAAAGSLGQGLIACESWAWAFLCRVWPLARPEALTLQGFTGSALSRLFAAMASVAPGRRITFKNAASGKEILTVPIEGDGASAELLHLAAHCRGNVGTARRHWRQSLRSEPEKDEGSAAASAAETTEVSSRDQVVWVSEAPRERAGALDVDEAGALVLHALLLQGGVPAALLADLLPLPHHRCMAVLLRLHDLGLVHLQGDRWIVADLGYPTVGQILRGRDFLTDGF